VIAFVLPLPFMLFFTVYRWRHRKERLYFFGYRYLGLLQALVVTLFITEVVKLYVGELRPDFLARCQPAGVPPVCTGSASVIKEGRKSFPSGHSSVTWCAMMYLSLMLAYELQVFTPGFWRGSKPMDDEQSLVTRSPTQQHYVLIRFFVAIVPLIVSTLVSISRVDDYWHHPHDVFWGGVLGSLVALAITRAHYYQPYGYHLLTALYRSRSHTTSAADKSG